MSETGNMPLDATGSCISCGKDSEMKCDRCGDSYCSESCQRKDWPHHRYICMPMPKLVKVGKSTAIDGSLNQALSHEVKHKVSQQFPNGSCVILVAFKTLNRCYIRSTNPSAVAEHEKFLTDVNECGKRSRPLNGRLKTDSFALSLRNEKWCRVQILGQDEGNNYHVLFVDFGQRSIRSLKELRKIESPLLNLPSSLTLVLLKNVPSMNVMDSLVQFTNKEYKIKYIKQQKSPYVVELYEWNTSNLLNSKLRSLFSEGDRNADSQVVSNIVSRLKIDEPKNIEHNGKEIPKINGVKNETVTSTSEDGKNELIAVHPGTSRESSALRQIQVQACCLKPPFEIIPLKENFSGKVMITDCSYIESALIGCLPEDYLENFKKVTKFLSEYDIPAKPYKPKLNEYCLANFENEWYRAKVVDLLSDGKFFVVYIDFTNEMELTSVSIRPYPMSLTLPCCTTLCSIDGLPYDITENQKKFLEDNVVPFQTLKVDSVRIEGNMRYINSNQLLNKMRAEKLL